jgi:hypothetical protein
MNPIKELLELAEQKENIEKAMRAGVAKARENGSSWQAIANVIGGTKQAAQQKYGTEKAAAQLLADQVEEHRKEDRAKLAEYAAKREEAAGQLEGQTAIFIDAQVPATEAEDEFAGARATANRILAAEAAAKAAKKAAKTITTPHRTDAPQADKDADDTMDRIESGELDTEGFTIDWTAGGKLKDGRCAKCSMTHHYEGKGRNLYFWIGPECNPTHRDTTQHR